MISTIILNYNRPAYLKNTVLPKLLSLNKVDEIIISHGKEKTFFEYNHKKIVHKKDWDINTKHGLSLRFTNAVNSKNDIILIIDDDIYTNNYTIDYLYNKLLENPKTIHGIYGRNLTKDNKYSTDLYIGECDIVLTRLLLCKKEICENFLKYKDEFEREYLIKNSKPFWNGEDIILNLLNYYINNQKSYSYDLPHTNRLHIFDIGNAISLDKSHLEYRSKLCNFFKNKFKTFEKKNKSKKKINFIYEIKNSNYYIYIIFLFFLICFFKLGSLTLSF